MTTHYKPAYCRVNGRWSEAICGEWIRDHEHADVPTCPTCAAEVAALQADTRTAEDVFGVAEPQSKR